MSTTPSIMTSKSILMHASLAYLSRELQTMNDVIHQISRTPSTCRKVILPTEILLLIREWLLPTITAQFIKQSIIALEAYEQSLRELLCQDCIGYNLDIYGPDIWQWEQFSGACACAPPGTDSEDPHGHRTTTSIGGIRHYHDYISKATPNTSILSVNPKQFVDLEHWLESYLSRQAKRALMLDVGGRGHSASSSAGPPSVDIWDVVNLVLQEFHCEATCEPGDKLRVHNRVRRGQFRTKSDFLQVIPVPCQTGSWTEHAFSGSTQEELDWRAHVILHRALRDLGLSLEYPVSEAFSARTRHVPFLAPRLRWPGVSSLCYEGQNTLDIFQILLRVIASFAAASISLPIAFATVALTVLCFYSKPKSFRIL